MEVSGVDPRDVRWEVERPVFRVYLWPHPDVCDEHRLVGAVDVDEVRAWIAAEHPGVPHVVYVEHDDGEQSRGLLRILGDEGTARSPVPPESSQMVAVLGVDGCPAGWVGVILANDGGCELLVAHDISSLVDAACRRTTIAAVAVDIPIGLPDAGPRRADVAARRRLTGGRKSSVFPTPTRVSVESLSWAEANQANRDATGGVGISKQAWHLFPRILDVDAYVRAGPPVPVREVHPEVVFAMLAGGSIAAGKRSAEGRAAREAALRRAGLEPPAAVRGSGYAVDDVLDACACALTAQRIAAGDAECLPDPPERFSDGLPAAIWV